MTFHIGQRVISIQSWGDKSQAPLTFACSIAVPEKYGIYTIRAFCPAADQTSLLLVEIVNPFEVTFARTRRRGEPSFAAIGFRPLTHTELFEGLLAGAPIKEFV